MTGVWPTVALVLIAAGALVPLLQVLVAARRNARDSRIRFGKPVDHPDLHFHQQYVTLRGKLLVDGGGEAVATAMRWEGDPLRTTRKADRLRLQTRGGTVELDGNLEVLVGSRETWRRSNLGDLFLRGDQVVERALADGDWILASGVLVGEAQTSFGGYRRAQTRWRLTTPPRGIPQIRLVFDGIPHLGSPPWRRVLSGALCGALLGILGLGLGASLRLERVPAPRSPELSRYIEVRLLDLEKDRPAGDADEAVAHARVAEEAALPPGRPSATASRRGCDHNYGRSWPSTTTSRRKARPGG